MSLWSLLPPGPVRNERCTHHGVQKVAPYPDATPGADARGFRTQGECQCWASAVDP